MLSRLVILVLLVSSEPAGIDRAAFAQAAYEVLGADVGLQLENVKQPVPDPELVKRAGQAAAVVELSWNESSHTAVLHTYIVNEQRWINRQIHFSKTDLPTDRGRLLGFIVGSMFVQVASGQTLPTQEEQPPPAPETQPELAAPMPPAANTTVPPMAPPPQQPPAAQDRAPSQAPKANTRSIDFAALASRGIGGTAEMMGATAALHWPIAGGWFVRTGASARVGEIAKADARTALLLGSIGAGWLVPIGNLELSARADLFAGWFNVSHFSPDDADPVRANRENLGADAFATVGYRITQGALLFGSLGAEYNLGRTEIVTHEQLVAVVPEWRATSEFGVRTKF